MIGVSVSVGVTITRVGVSVGVMGVGGGGVSVGVAGGMVGVGRLRLIVTRFSTSVLSPAKVNLRVMIPFGILDKSHV